MEGELDEVFTFNGPLMLIPKSQHHGNLEAGHDKTTTAYPLWTLDNATVEKLCNEGGLVVPTGYSFNLDGTCIYLTMAVLFLAQATNTPLTVGAELGVLGVLLVSSKGAAAVTGGGFITLVATLESTRTVPVEAIALLLGIDRFMSEVRAFLAS